MSQVPQNLFELYVEEIFSYLRLEINLLEHFKVGVMIGKRLFFYFKFSFFRGGIFKRYVESEKFTR